MPDDRQTMLLNEGRAALIRTGEAIAGLADQLGGSFVQAVDVILGCRGHVIVSGAGTSSTIARRLAHLLTCVGAPALYLDSGQAVHGSAAAITAHDVLVVISKGGQTDELNTLARLAHERGAPVIAMTGSSSSPLAQLSDVVLAYTVDRSLDGGEGSIALGSSLASGAVGDALCFAVLSVRGFNPTEFLKVHPAGAVGKQLRAEHDS
ncbi:MAG: hypothetical protein Kow00124_20120 [Anaerolineae bacterium]